MKIWMKQPKKSTNFIKHIIDFITTLYNWTDHTAFCYIIKEDDYFKNSFNVIGSDNKQTTFNTK